MESVSWLGSQLCDTEKLLLYKDRGKTWYLRTSYPVRVTRNVQEGDKYYMDKIRTEWKVTSERNRVRNSVPAMRRPGNAKGLDGSLASVTRKAAGTRRMTA